MESIAEFINKNIPSVTTIGIRILMALIIFLVGRFLIKWIRKGIRSSFERTNADAGVAQFTDSLLKFGLYLLLILAVAANVGIEISSVTVLFASAGVGISLSLQGTLSNLAGGFLILLLKPFSVGDYIVEDTHKNEGTVKEIQIFYTKLQTLDNKIVVVPNGILANNSLTNSSVSAQRQLDLRIRISYKADLKKAKQLIFKVLEEDESVLKEEELKVFVDELAETAVVLGVRAWVESSEYWEAKWRIQENIKLIYDAEKVEIPYTKVLVQLEGSSER